MAVSMVSDPESEQELEESHLMLKNDCFCFRMSSYFVDDIFFSRFFLNEDSRIRKNRLGKLHYRFQRYTSLIKTV